MSHVTLINESWRLQEEDERELIAMCDSPAAAFLQSDEDP